MTSHYGREEEPREGVVMPSGGHAWGDPPEPEQRVSPMPGRPWDAQWGPGRYPDDLPPMPPHPPPPPPAPPVPGTDGPGATELIAPVPGGRGPDGPGPTPWPSAGTAAALPPAPPAPVAWPGPAESATELIGPVGRPPVPDAGWTGAAPGSPEDPATQLIGPVPAGPEERGWGPPDVPGGPGGWRGDAPTELIGPVGRPPVPDAGWTGAAPGSPHEPATQLIPPVGEDPTIFVPPVPAGGAAHAATQVIPPVDGTRAPPAPGYGHGPRPGGRAAARRAARAVARDRDRTPVMVGVIVIAVCLVVGLVVGAVLSGGADAGGTGDGAPASQDRGGEDTRTTAATAPTTVPAETDAAATAEPTEDPGAGAVSAHQAAELSLLLDQSSAGRDSAVAAVSAIQSCGNLRQAAQDLRAAAVQRQSLITLLDQLALDALPDHQRLAGSLRTAWERSADADNAFAAWADEIRGQKRKNCQDGVPRQTQSAAAGNTASAEATAAKGRAVELWNPIARTHGLPERQADTL